MQLRLFRILTTNDNRSQSQPWYHDTTTVVYQYTIDMKPEFLYMYITVSTITEWPSHMWRRRRNLALSSVYLSNMPCSICMFFSHPVTPSKALKYRLHVSSRDDIGSLSSFHWYTSVRRRFPVCEFRWGRRRQTNVSILKNTKNDVIETRSFMFLGVV
jgi:hypothetical protein